MPRLYRNKETLETTADYGVVEEWQSDGVNVSVYEKIGEL